MPDETQPAPVQAKQFECHGCGAKMQFDPKAGKQKCPYCGFEHDVPTSEEQIRELDFNEYLAKAGAAGETVEQHTVKCNSCGAETTLAANVTSDKCAYCGLPAQTAGGSRRLIKPKSLLPFKITVQQAHEAFCRWIAGLWFAPGGLKALSRESAPMNGLYVPYWTYDANTTSFYRGERGVHYWETQRDAQGHTRQVRKTRWHPASGVVYVSFDDVLVLASRNLPGNHADALAPWDLQGLVGYADEYVSGFKTESYQVDLAQGFEVARAIMDAAIREAARRDIGGDEQRVHSVRTQYGNVTFKHVLLPIWISAYRFGVKVYRFLVNGRTGKVRGERPWSWVKIALLVMAILSALAIVAVFAASR